LFTAAGSSLFPEHPSYDTDSYQRKLFSGSKPFTQEMKDGFPKPFNVDGLESFFQVRIGDSSLPQIMSNFGIPSDEPQNKNRFISALCEQFRLIVTDAADDVNDVVLPEYRRLLSETESEFLDFPPLYPGDSLRLVEGKSTPIHIVGFYEKFEHTWVVENNGSVTWRDRWLECTNSDVMKVKSANTRIDISTTKPGNEASLSAQFDARGFEGTHESVWEMKDEKGQLCFPDKDMALKMVVSVVNRNHSPAEVEATNG
jgi:hypothetical protein